MSLDFKKGKLKKGGGERELFKSQHFNPRRESHWIYRIVRDPQFQITSSILGPTSFWLLHCSASDLPLPHRPLGWALEVPPHGHQGFLALLIISIFMTRLVNKTSKLATYVYLRSSSSTKQRRVWGLVRH